MEDIIIFTPEEKRWEDFLAKADAFLKKLPLIRAELDDEEVLNLEIKKLAEKKLAEIRDVQKD